MLPDDAFTTIGPVVTEKEGVFRDDRSAGGALYLIVTRRLPTKNTAFIRNSWLGPSSNGTNHLSPPNPLKYMINENIERSGQVFLLTQ